METVKIENVNVHITEDPTMEERGFTSITYDWDVLVRVQKLGDLDGRVLLHELLHALLTVEPNQICGPSNPKHEDFVRFLTKGLHDILNYRRLINEGVTNV